MKNIISGLNKAFESRIRLGIMSALVVNDMIEYNQLKILLDVTDGNLASHIKALVKLEYITVDKQLVGNKTKTCYSITSNGKRAFQEHINFLEKLIKQ
jgi:DNA-binding MarR family transcriptional regulator